MSADGSVIVGFGYSALGQEAFIWTQAEGLRNLRQVLINDYGLELTGWTLIDAYDISSDGRVIVGRGLNPSGDSEAWRAVVPEPCGTALLGMGCAAFLARRRKG